MLNHIVLMGRLTRDPELRRTGSGIPVTTFTLAVDRDFGSNKETGEKETDFIDIVTWRNTAEFVSKYFAKGRMIIVDGRLEMRDWTDKEGNKRTSAEIVVANAYFGDSKRDGDSGFSSYGGNTYGGNSYGGSSYAAPVSAPAAPSYGSYPAPSAPASDFAMLEDDDAQLPF